MIVRVLLCVILLLILLAVFFRLGVLIGREPAGFFLKIRLGPWYLPIFPRKKDPEKERKKKEKKSAKRKKKEEKKAKKPPKPKKQPNIPGILGLVSDLLPVLEDAAGMFFRRLQIDELALDLTWSGEDPADTAIRYGRCWAATESALALLENLTVIRKRQIAIRWNCQLEKSLYYGRIGLSVTVAQLIVVGTVFLVRGVKAFLPHRKNLFKPRNDPVPAEAGATETKGAQNHGKEPCCERNDG